MPDDRHVRGLVLLTTGLALLCLVGCPRYEIETTVGRDGGGRRVVTLEADGDISQGTDVTTAEFLSLFGLDEGRGWITTSRAGDDKLVFTCEEQIADPAGWSNLECDLQVRGSLSEGPLEEIRFREEVAVETRRGAEGRTVAYRATFGWHGLQEALTDLVVGHFSESVARQYPFLNKAELAELRGLFAGHFSVGWLTEGEDVCSLEEDTVLASFASLAEPIVRAARPTADVSALRVLAEESADGADSLVSEQLPGVELAVFASANLRLTLPGRILETNGTIVGDGTVEWKLDLLDERMLRGPLEIYASASVEP